MVWIYSAVWVLVMGGLTAARGFLSMGTGTLIFLEACLLMAGLVALGFWRKAQQPPESLAELLHRIENLQSQESKPERLDKAA